jgi:hypothetical protein
VTPTPRVRRAWRIAASVGAAALLVWGVQQTISLLAHEEHDEVTTFPAASIDVIDLDLGNGSVEITASDVDEITVHAHISDGLRPTGHDERVEGNRLVLESSCPLFLTNFCSVDYEVTVPADVEVRGSIDNGHLDVTGTNGSVDARASNGAITLVEVEGDVELRSDNGSLTAAGLVADTVTASTSNGSVDLGFAEPPSFVDADSDNGSIELRLPPVGGGYRVDMDTDNGSTDLGVATDPGSGRHITASTSNGDVRVLGVDGGAG